MPRLIAPGSIATIGPLNGKTVDVNALNFLLLGETDFNSKNPDNELGPIVPIAGAGLVNALIPRPRYARLGAAPPADGGATYQYPIYSPACIVRGASMNADAAARANPNLVAYAEAIARAAGDAAELVYATEVKRTTEIGVRHTNSVNEDRYEADNEASRELQKAVDRARDSELAARSACNALQAVVVAIPAVAAVAFTPARAGAGGARSVGAITGVTAVARIAVRPAGANEAAVTAIFAAAAAVAAYRTRRALGADGSNIVPAFAHHICYFNEYYTNLGRPSSIEELIGSIRRNHSAAFNQFLRQGQWKNKSITASSFIAAFEKAIGSKVSGAPSFTHDLEVFSPHWNELKQEFTLNEINQSMPGFIAPQPQLNSANLHVALLYPGVAQYLKKVRSKLLNNAYAVRSPFFPNMSRGGITFQIQTGGNNIENLNSSYPIEMRGFGHLIASSMKGGNFSGLAIGTVNSPTIWRPLTDDSYIGDSLVTATNNLKAKLQSLNITLDPLVEQKIAGRLNDLRNAEQAAKNYRDKLNIVARLNGPAGTGDGQVDWTNAGRNPGARANQINDNDVDKLVDDYNRSMQQVVKNEGVVLKVLDQLGRVVAEHRV
jgi:hypothetical protein